MDEPAIIAPHMGKVVVVYLKDGRVIDVSGLTAGEASNYLQQLGVRSPAEIERIVHQIAGARWSERPGRG